MNSRLIIFIILIATKSFISCSEYYSKRAALEQLKFCLKGISMSSSVLNQRNPVLLDFMTQRDTNNKIIEDYNFNEIEKLTKIILIEVDNQIDFLQKSQDEHLDKQLFKNTIEYIKFTKEYTLETKQYFELIQDSIIDNEIESSKKIKELVNQSTSQIKLVKSQLSEFCAKYDIKQKEIDSIIDITAVKK